MSRKKARGSARGLAVRTYWDYSIGAIPAPGPALSVRVLVERGHTVAALERTLGLSPGYLSKVRHGAVRPSPQLVALLEVLRVHPAALATVEAVTRVQTAKDPRAGK